MNTRVPLIDIAVHSYETAYGEEEKTKSRSILELLLDAGGAATPELFEVAVKLAENGDKTLWKTVLKRFTNMTTDTTYSRERHKEAIEKFLDYCEKHIEECKAVLTT